MSLKSLIVIYGYFMFLIVITFFGGGEGASTRFRVITLSLDAPHSVGLLWTSDQLYAQTST